MIEIQRYSLLVENIKTKEIYNSYNQIFQLKKIL